MLAAAVSAAAMKAAPCWPRVSPLIDIVIFGLPGRSFALNLQQGISHYHKCFSHFIGLPPPLYGINNAALRPPMNNAHTPEKALHHASRPQLRRVNQECKAKKVNKFPQNVTPVT